MSNDNQLFSCNKLVALREGRPVFAPISFTVNAGSCHQLVGSNGAGKSTFFQTIIGLKDYLGTFEITNASLLGPNNALYQNLTVAESIESWRIQSCTTNLASKLPQATLVQNLSSGQKRLLAWARIQMTGKQLWLLDEPLINLDNNVKTMVIAVIRQHLANGGAIIVATHLTDIWADIIDFQHNLQLPSSAEIVSCYAD